MTLIFVQDTPCVYIYHKLTLILTCTTLTDPVTCSLTITHIGFNNDNFNDVDEYFVRVFAEQVQTLLLAAQVHQAAFVKTELYSALMRIPTDLHCAIPKKETSDVRRKITPR